MDSEKLRRKPPEAERFQGDRLRKAPFQAGFADGPDLMLHFTDLYRQMGYLEEKGLIHLFLRDIPGTNLYLDPEAEKELMERLSPYPPGGIHFLDNGNYHYVTRLFLSMLKGPFDLLVLDHHRDDQAPAFEGTRSCGSWIRDAGEDFGDRFKSLILILSGGQKEVRGEPDPARPLYLSIDKDILDPGVFRTNWDQGNMTLPEMEEILRSELSGRYLAGADLCGETAEAGGIYEEAALSANREVNDRLYRFLNTYRRRS